MTQTELNTQITEPNMTPQQARDFNEKFFKPLVNIQYDIVITNWTWEKVTFSEDNVKAGFVCTVVKESSSGQPMRDVNKKWTVTSLKAMPKFDKLYGVDKLKKIRVSYLQTGQGAKTAYEVILSDVA